MEMRSLKALFVLTIPIMLVACGSADAEDIQTPPTTITKTVTSTATTTVTETDVTTSMETTTVTEAPEPVAEPDTQVAGIGNADIDSKPRALVSVPDPAPAPTPAPVYTNYANCAAVRAAGAAPLYAGSPGYSRKLDRDGDGIACEK